MWAVVCHELIFWHLSYHQLTINWLDVLISPVFTSISLTSLHCVVPSCRLLTDTNAKLFVQKLKLVMWVSEQQPREHQSLSRTIWPPKRCVQGRLVKQRPLTMTIWEQWNADQQTDRQQRAACLANIKEHTAGKIHPHPALLPSHMAHFQF